VSNPFLLLFLILMLSVLLTGLFVLMVRLFLFDILPAVSFGAVFVPIKDEKLGIMINLADPKKGDKIIDIGSGDGKILIALANKGVPSEGVEINPYLVHKSTHKIRQMSLDDLAKVSNKSFWSVDFSKYDIIFLYGMNHFMKKLEQKLLREMVPGSRVVSNYFKFPNWKPSKETEGVRLYIKN
jgi:tRNA A58 N-methylase Trm61